MVHNRTGQDNETQAEWDKHCRFEQGRKVKERMGGSRKEQDRAVQDKTRQDGTVKTKPCTTSPIRLATIGWYRMRQGRSQRDGIGQNSPGQSNPRWDGAGKD